MVERAAALFDAGQRCGKEANMAKMLASEASWAAAEACLQTHGGFGFAEEYDVERKYRETRLYQVAPIRSEEHTSELQSLMRISYAVFCLKKKNKKPTVPHT